MDHHSDILGCCIGFCNYKSFILSMVYLFVLLIIVIVNTFVLIFRSPKEEKVIFIIFFLNSVKI